MVDITVTIREEGGYVSDGPWFKAVAKGGNLEARGEAKRPEWAARAAIKSLRKKIQHAKEMH
jgi:hypothetical protein